jgi:hypothetical protein
LNIQILVICAAVLLTMVGVWMRGSIHRYRMDMEESAKDQLISTEAADGRIRRYRRVSAFCVAAGIGLMVFAMLFLGI